MSAPQKIDSQQLRKVAGAFATGVTIVTTEKEDGAVHGMTANSFLSVSLDPALVSFCVKKGASILEYIHPGKSIGISILNADQKEVSQQFAGQNKDKSPVPMIKKEGASIIKDALAWYSTKVNQIIPAGDHLLILLDIYALDRATDGSPLLYFSGYRTVGEVV